MELTIGYIEPRTHYLGNWSPREMYATIWNFRGQGFSWFELQVGTGAWEAKNARRTSL